MSETKKQKFSEVRRRAQLLFAAVMSVNFLVIGFLASNPLFENMRAFFYAFFIADTAIVGFVAYRIYKDFRCPKCDRRVTEGGKYLLSARFCPACGADLE